MVVVVVEVIVVVVVVVVVALLAVVMDALDVLRLGVTDEEEAEAPASIVSRIR